MTSTPFSGNYRCGQGTWISPHEIKSAFSLQWVAAQPSQATQQQIARIRRAQRCWDRRLLKLLASRRKKRKVNSDQLSWYFGRDSQLSVCKPNHRINTAVFTVRKTLRTSSHCQQYSTLMPGLEIPALLFCSSRIFFQGQERLLSYPPLLVICLSQPTAHLVDYMYLYIYLATWRPRLSVRQDLSYKIKETQICTRTNGFQLLIKNIYMRRQVLLLWVI